MANGIESVQEQVNNQLEHILALCESYVEADQLEDVGNIRALYEEYAEWIQQDTDEVISNFSISSTTFEKPSKSKTNVTKEATAGWVQEAPLLTVKAAQPTKALLLENRRATAQGSDCQTAWTGASTEKTGSWR